MPLNDVIHPVKFPGDAVAVNVTIVPGLPEVGEKENAFAGVIVGTLGTALAWVVLALVPAAFVLATT